MIADPTKILRRPVVTEKSTKLREGSNQVVFEVSDKSTKPQIKAAIEKLFKVKVMSVNTMIVRGKFKCVGRYEGKRPNWKKAIARLKSGDKIDLFEGV